MRLLFQFSSHDSIFNWSPSRCLYCSDGTAQVGALLCPLPNSAFLFELGFPFLCFPPNFLCMNCAPFSNSEDTWSNLGHYYWQYFSELLEHVLPHSFPILPMPSLYRFTWILAFLKQKGWNYASSFKSWNDDTVAESPFHYIFSIWLCSFFNSGDKNLKPMTFEMLFSGLIIETFIEDPFSLFIQ